MHFATVFFASLAAFAGVASAAPAPPPPGVDGPFALQIFSQDANYNGKYLSYEPFVKIHALVVPSATKFAWYLNTTESNTLVFAPYQWGEHYRWRIATNTLYNTGPVYLDLGIPEYNFVFDPQGFLSLLEPTLDFQQWFICPTYVPGWSPPNDVINSLSWRSGKRAPDVVECVKVRVKKATL
ncbi:hypothetical protein ABW20_dc0105590 [Dactylellina cionopaga]|nr:hypothetical protein ABW20_dc0105590 [Dactylellina cionopaga]